MKRVAIDDDVAEVLAEASRNPSHEQRLRKQVRDLTPNDREVVTKWIKGLIDGEPQRVKRVLGAIGGARRALLGLIEDPSND